MTDFFGEYEDLCPELEAYFEDDGKWPMIRHPLVYSIMHNPIQNRMVNRQLEEKKDALERARLSQDWNSFVFLHERPYRCNALTKLMGFDVPDDWWWKLVAEVWVDSENIRENREVWDVILRGDSRRGPSGAMMNDDEYAELRAMDETFTVWQGCTSERDDGWSWTIDKEKAEWFAERFAKLEHAGPRLREATVRRDDVIAYFTGRNESEILIDPEDVIV
jgi:hypothetical protein